MGKVVLLLVFFCVFIGSNRNRPFGQVGRMGPVEGGEGEIGLGFVGLVEVLPTETVLVDVVEVVNYERAVAWSVVVTTGSEGNLHQISTWGNLVRASRTRSAGYS